MSIENTLGVVTHEDGSRPTDYLYRVSLKCLIRNEKDEILVVKEVGRDWWDLPGGGMDHGENIKNAIAREMLEEVNLQGDFEFKIIAVDEPGLLEHGFWQIRLIFEVYAKSLKFSTGVDSDEITFMPADNLKDSKKAVESRIYKYFQHSRM
jgi:8-oxo-dGTP diphosphatase